jgi:hypothetical protein
MLFMFEQLVKKDGTRGNLVAKVSKDPNEDRNTYYRDVQAQTVSKQWAMEYNDCGIPKSGVLLTANPVCLLSLLPLFAVSCMFGAHVGGRQAGCIHAGFARGYPHSCEWDLRKTT